MWNIPHLQAESVDGGLGRQEHNIRNTRCSGNELVNSCLHWEYHCEENVFASCFALLGYVSPCSGFKGLPDIFEDQTESLLWGLCSSQWLTMYRSRTTCILFAYCKVTNVY